MIIFKGKTNRTIKKLVVPTGFVVATQDKAWMDDHLMLRYIDEIWMPYVKTTGCTESILCLDKFQAHISASTDSKLKANNVHPSVIPGDCRSVLQPLDVCLNKPFKSLLRHSWQNYMLKCSEKTLTRRFLHQVARTSSIGWKTPGAKSRQRGEQNQGKEGRHNEIIPCHGNQQHVWNMGRQLDSK